MCENFCLQKSNLTLSLKKDFIFISSYSGFFIFGSIVNNHYQKNKFFHFSHFDLPKLYNSILKFIHFIADNKESLDRTDILTKEIEGCSVSYFILGNIESNKKIVKFCLECNSEVFELSFTVFQLNDFLNTLNDIILNCLCLQSVEKNMILLATLEPLEKIVTFRKYEDAKKFLSIQYENVVCVAKIDNLTPILVHYNYIVIILHKLKSLVNKDIIENLYENIIDLL